ncbi:MAG: addiction module antidote protein, HigA family [Desulfobulbaceae bacterium]|nr:MAG: addiction module antidote protein, HigA family [Desulfobulbaceae bacterium]
MKMHNPPHPGEVLKELCLAPLGLSVTEVADGLGVSTEDLVGVLECRQAVSAEIAIRLAKAFGGSAETWLRHQMEYDLWHLNEGLERPVFSSFRFGTLAGHSENYFIMINYDR